MMKKAATSAPSSAAASAAELANALRALSMDAVQKANSGHPGMPMGMADVATVLFRKFLRFDAAAPNWHNRDRFVLSAGHGSMLLYSLLYCCGYSAFPLAQLKRFRQAGARAAGHPEYNEEGVVDGVETTTGPLGQGLANAVGMALAESLLRRQYGAALCDHRVFVVAGDGCLMEGISHEAASLAGHLRLQNLIVLFDDNGISIDGPTSLATGDNTPARFAAYGWHTESCDGHNPADIARALRAACKAKRPSLVACKTVIGRGAPNLQGTAKTHGAPLGAEEVAAARRALGWRSPPFVVPPRILQAWRKIGARGAAARKKWEANAKASARGREFCRRMAGELPKNWDSALRSWRAALQNGEARKATRQASGEALERLLPALPQLLGGSADLTGSNNTRAGGQRAISATSGGGYVHYGVREHAMAAALNGIALHGGFIPYGGTFLVFSDYSRPAIRLAAMCRLRVIHVFTHDSIGLGEDGPTHQPVEHLAALRAIPRLRVWRPCDTAETAECWRLAIATRGPSALALSRQGLPQVAARHAHKCGRGAYILAAAAGGRAQITLAASGSEVALALAAARLLAAKGARAAVVSAPCMELFLRQSPAARAAVVPPRLPLLTVEAGITAPWRAWAAALGVTRAAHLGVDDFGMSAPAADVYARFKLTPRDIAAAAMRLLKKK